MFSVSLNKNPEVGQMYVSLLKCELITYWGVEAIVYDCLKVWRFEGLKFMSYLQEFLNVLVFERLSESVF